MVDLKAARAKQLREAIELFYFAYRAFTSGPDKILDRYALGRVHHRILYFVGRNPGVSVNALLEILSVSKQALNAPMRQLIERGFIVAGTDSRDRRFKLLCLTSEGKKLESQLTGTQMKLLGVVFGAEGIHAESAWRMVMRSMPLHANPKS
jgi:DNA-binding MarR family transcriptional regulator